jgi:AbiV family abortive infection protein
VLAAKRVAMRAVLANARSLVEDAEVLAEAGRQLSAALLLTVAEVEAARYHVLLDAVRCERRGPNVARQLKRFNDHLAKGLYARYVMIVPASFGEALEFLERERRMLYLDGPNDVDRIFGNSILQDRNKLSMSTMSNQLGSICGLSQRSQSVRIRGFSSLGSSPSRGRRRSLPRPRRE